MTTPYKGHMRRCTSSFVIAAYAKVRLIFQESCALPLDLYTKPLMIELFPVKLWREAR